MENDSQKQKVIKEQGITNHLRPRLLSLKHAAVYMDRTPWGMRELYWAGKVPIVKDGKKIYFDVRDLDRYVEANKTLFE
jgi:hypothetical protein